MTLRCHCGQPLHYTDPVIEAWMARIVADHGEFITILGPVGDEVRAFAVSRHYIALHGVTMAELPYLGFAEVPRGVP